MYRPDRQGRRASAHFQPQVIRNDHRVQGNLLRPPRPGSVGMSATRARWSRVCLWESPPPLNTWTFSICGPRNGKFPGRHPAPLGTDRSLSAVPRTHPRQLHGQPFHRGPLTSAVPVVLSQDKASRTGAGEVARRVAAGVGAGARAAQALVPVWGVRRAGGLHAQALLPSGLAARPSQAERPPLAMPGLGEGAYPHKTLPGHLARSLLGSRPHSLL